MEASKANSKRKEFKCACKGRSHVCPELKGLQRWDHERRELLMWAYLGRECASLIGRRKVSNGSK